VARDLSVYRGLSLRDETGRMGWSMQEIRELRDALAKIPSDWVERNPFLTSVIRKDVLRSGPPGAPGHSLYDPKTKSITLFDKGVYDGGKEINREQFRRSLFHELGHSVLEKNPGIISSWVAETKNDKFVDEYAKTNPKEDFCDTFSEYFINPEVTAKAVPIKAAFMRKLSGSQEEKTAMPFLGAFVDELKKTAGVSKAAPGLLAKLREGAPMAARLGLVGAGAGVLGNAIGKHTGEQRGLEEGSASTKQVAQEAYQAGVRRGAIAMKDAIMKSAAPKDPGPHYDTRTGEAMGATDTESQAATKRNQWNANASAGESPRPGKPMMRAGGAAGGMTQSSGQPRPPMPDLLEPYPASKPDTGKPASWASGHHFIGDLQLRPEFGGSPVKNMIGGKHKAKTSPSTAAVQGQDKPFYEKYPAGGQPVGVNTVLRGDTNYEQPKNTSPAQAPAKPVTKQPNYSLAHGLYDEPGGKNQQARLRPVSAQTTAHD